MDAAELRTRFDRHWEVGNYRLAADVAATLAIHQRDEDFNYTDAGFWLGVAGVAAQLATASPPEEVVVDPLTRRHWIARRHLGLV